jgi:hypothetical protein
MSYAIETKKRKFDRILESLTDGAASPSRLSLDSRKNASSTSLSQDSASDLSKRRRITPTSAPTTATPPTSASLSGHYLPSSRSAFLGRLETFRDVTRWHIPSTGPINAAAWAKRGWVCSETDTVSCGACSERLHIDLSIDTERHKAWRTEEQEGGDKQASDNEDDEEEDFGISSAVYDNVVIRYQGLIVTAHADGCLWRKRGSDPSIQRIEGLLNTNMALSGLRSRYNTLTSHDDDIPDVESLPEVAYVQPEELEEFHSNTEDKLDVNALKLAICGWERRSEDVVECHHCFRSLGLWLYRGERPAVEKLDAVDSHLDYCPWKSAEAQDTEVQLPHHQGTNERSMTKIRVPGWVLVYQAIAKNNRQRRPRTATSIAPSEPVSSQGSNDSTTSENREKKMKELLRRMKEIKKPFNVKGLLRRKGKAAT